MPEDKPQPRQDPDLEPFKNFFTVVGYAITQWAFIDEKLFEFFHFSLGVDKKKAATIFYGAQTISQHLAMTDKVMRMSLSQRHLNVWTSIVSDINEHLPLRNHLAHDPHRYSPNETYTLADLAQNRPSRRRLDPYEIVTAEPKLLAKKQWRQTRYPEIIGHIGAVFEIDRKLKELRAELPARARKQREARPTPKRAPKKGARKGSRRNAARRQRPPE